MTAGSDTRRDQLNRLRRIEGHVRGLARTVEEDHNCIDVLTQYRAVEGPDA
jgi:DNA-binding FrmR family transcriptional regulator